MTVRYLPIQPSTDWRRGALCAQVDTDIFYPEKGGSTRDAKRLCAGCDVRAECLEDALEHNEPHGVWGGLTDAERRQLKPRSSGPRAGGVTDAIAGVRRAAA